MTFWMPNHGPFAPIIWLSFVSLLAGFGVSTSPGFGLPKEILSNDELLALASGIFFCLAYQFYMRRALQDVLLYFPNFLYVNTYFLALLGLAAAFQFVIVPVIAPLVTDFRLDVAARAAISAVALLAVCAGNLLGSSPSPTAADVNVRIADVRAALRSIARVEPGNAAIHSEAARLTGLLEQGIVAIASLIPRLRTTSDRRYAVERLAEFNNCQKAFSTRPTADYPMLAREINN